MIQRAEGSVQIPDYLVRLSRVQHYPNGLATMRGPIFVQRACRSLATACLIVGGRPLTASRARLSNSSSCIVDGLNNIAIRRPASGCWSLQRGRYFRLSWATPFKAKAAGRRQSASAPTKGRSVDVKKGNVRIPSSKPRVGNGEWLKKFGNGRADLTGLILSTVLLMTSVAPIG